MRKRFLPILLIFYIILFLNSTALGADGAYTIECGYHTPLGENCAYANWCRYNPDFKDSGVGAPDETLRALRQKKLDELTAGSSPVIRPVAGGLDLDKPLSVEYGMPIYGGTKSIPTGTSPLGWWSIGVTQMQDENGEWRFLGYTMLGDPISNMWFRPDGVTSRTTTTPFSPAIDDFSSPMRQWVKLSPASKNPPGSYNIWGDYWDNYKDIDSRDFNKEIFGGDRIYMNGSDYPADSLVARCNGKNGQSYGFEDGYKKMLEIYGNGSTTWGSFKDNTSMTSWFAVISPYSPVTPLQVVGLFGGGSYYRTYIVYPHLEDIPLGPNIEITFPATAPGNPPGSGYSGPLNTSKTGPFPFTATVQVQITDATDWPATHEPIGVYVRTIIDGTKGSFGKPVPIGDFTKNTAKDPQTFTFTYNADFNQTIQLQAMVNPVVDQNVAGFPPILDGNGDPLPDATYRVIQESDTTDNYKTVSFSTNDKPSTEPEKNFLKFNPIYTYVDKPIQINMDNTFNNQAPKGNNSTSYSSSNDYHRIFTYRPNRIVMETSIYTEKVEIVFNDRRNDGDPGTTYKVTLVRDGNKVEKYTRSGINYVAANSTCDKYIDEYLVNFPTGLNVKDDLRTKGKPVGNKDYDDEYKRVWTFDFTMKNYGIYPEPIANDTQIDNLIFTAFDHNGKVDKPRSEEINPLSYVVNIRQTKLFNLRISDVKDIYWKYIFNNTSGLLDQAKHLNDAQPTKPPFGVKNLPLAQNALNKRFISKGYAVQFKVDSEGLYRSGDRMIVVPTFWWFDSKNNKFREVDLYYDIPNKNLYNIPIENVDYNDSSKYNDSNLKKKTLESLKTTNNLSNSQLDEIKKIYLANITAGNDIVTSYTKFQVDPTKIKKSQDGYLLSGKENWKFSNNDIANPTIIQDNYYKRFTPYKNTWTFTYSLHPKVKAFIKDEPYNPFTTKPLSGALLVNLKIVTTNSLDGTKYLYNKYEDTWHKGINATTIGNLNSIVTDKGTSEELQGKGNVFYYNLDWSALDDYTAQQKW